MTDSKMMIASQRVLLRDWDAEAHHRELLTQSALAAEMDPVHELAFEASAHKRFLTRSLVAIRAEQADIHTFDLHATLAAHFDRHSKLFTK